MTYNKVKTLLGFALKAKKLCIGQDSIEKMLGKGQIRSVLVDRGISANSLKKLRLKAEQKNVAIYCLESGFIGNSLSLEGVLAVGLLKSELSDEIIKNIDESMAIIREDIE